VGWQWTVRLQANTGVTVAGQGCQVRALLAARWAHRWRCWAGNYGQGARAIAATLVVGHGLVVLPRHRRTAASLAPVAKRRRERRRIRLTRYPGVDQTDHWVVLCTSHPDWRTAVYSYRQRWAIEGSYRDAQGGWDGRHGWDLEALLTQLRQAAQVERVVGLWALASLLQTYLGAQVLAGPAWVQAVARQWTTTGRLSIWAQGQCALADPSGVLHDWLLTTFQAGAAQIAHAAPPARPHPQAAPPASAPPLLQHRKEAA
jgi:hypothetical protein